MKKHVIFVLMAFTGLNVLAQPKHLDKLPQKQRDSILVAIAKETILEYGPDWYEENQPPVINRFVVTPDGVYPTTGATLGRVGYGVKYLCDPAVQKEFPTAFLAWIGIWADTGKPTTISFGNGMGIVLYQFFLTGSEDDKSKLFVMPRKPGYLKKPADPWRYKGFK